MNRYKYNTGQVLERLYLVLMLLWHPVPLIAAEPHISSFISFDTNITKKYQPPLLKGLKLYIDDPLKLNFLTHKGDAQLEGKDWEEASLKMIRYFLAAMTIPEGDLWVNLSPHEPERIIPHTLGQTEMGYEMLSQDYLLKQLTSYLMHPGGRIGEQFWQSIYETAYQKYGTTDMDFDTFSKVWVVPDKSVVYQNMDTVYIVESRLKVLLEEDYISQQNHVQLSTGKTSTMGQVSKDALRSLIIPLVEEEINNGQTFAPLRMIFHSLILARWYKQTVKNGLLNQQFVGQKKMSGLAVITADNNEMIYDHYVQSYQKGAFDYIKEEYDPLTTQVIQRKYFSGGIQGDVNLTQSFSGEDLSSLIGNDKVDMTLIRLTSNNSDESKDLTIDETIWEAISVTDGLPISQSVRNDVLKLQDLISRLFSVLPAADLRKKKLLVDLIQRSAKFLISQVPFIINTDNQIAKINKDYFIVAYLNQQLRQAYQNVDGVTSLFVDVEWQGQSNMDINDVLEGFNKDGLDGTSIKAQLDRLWELHDQGRRVDVEEYKKLIFDLDDKILKLSERLYSGDILPFIWNNGLGGWNVNSRFIDRSLVLEFLIQQHQHLAFIDDIDEVILQHPKKRSIRRLGQINPSDFNLLKERHAKILRPIFAASGLEMTTDHIEHLLDNLTVMDLTSENLSASYSIAIIMMGILPPEMAFQAATIAGLHDVGKAGLIYGPQGNVEELFDESGQLRLSRRLLNAILFGITAKSWSHLEEHMGEKIDFHFKNGDMPFIPNLNVFASKFPDPITLTSMPTDASQQAARFFISPNSEDSNVITLESLLSVFESMSDPVPEARRQSDQWHKYNLYGLYDFEEEDFAKNKLTQERLLNRLRQDNIIAPDSIESDINKLRYIIRQSNLYLYVEQIPVYLNDYLTRLENNEILKEDEIILFNRMLFEANYPDETPPSLGAKFMNIRQNHTPFSLANLIKGDFFNRSVLEPIKQASQPKVLTMDEALTVIAGHHNYRGLYTEVLDRFVDRDQKVRQMIAALLLVDVYEALRNRSDLGHDKSISILKGHLNGFDVFKSNAIQMEFLKMIDRIDQMGDVLVQKSVLSVYTTSLALTMYASVSEESPSLTSRTETVVEGEVLINIADLLKAKKAVGGIDFNDLSMEWQGDSANALFFSDALTRSNPTIQGFTPKILYVQPAPNVLSILSVGFIETEGVNFSQFSLQFY